MIDLRKKDPVAESIKQIMEKELSAKQKRIAALAGDKKSIDALDLAALRAGKKPTSEEAVSENAFDFKSPRPVESNGGSGVKKGTRYGGSKQKDKPEQDDDKMKKEEVVEEGMKTALKKLGKKTFKALTGGSDRDQLKALQRRAGAPVTGKKPTSEEVESLDEGKMDHMSLTHLWHAHAKHTYGADQGWGSGQGGHHSDHAATAIENHVRKHHGNKVADDMVAHSNNHVAHAEYVGGKEAKEVEKSAEKLRKKHGIKGDLYGHHESVNEEVQIDESVSRKHFQQVADVIKAHPDQEKRNELAKHHAEIFKKQNPRFDHGRFYTAAGANLKEEVVAEGLPQTLRKVVPGYAKREIDKKMDAGKFGKTDADKDANFQRYKKIQDKLKEQVVAEGSKLTKKEYVKRIDQSKKDIEDMRKQGTFGPAGSLKDVKWVKKQGVAEGVKLDEKAPPGFEGTVKAMKKHKDITNPFALAWSMKNKGYESHKKSDGSDK